MKKILRNAMIKYKFFSFHVHLQINVRDMNIIISLTWSNVWLLEIRYLSQIVSTIFIVSVHSRW